MADILDELREAYDYDTNGWQDIRNEAKIDMRYVGGDPWDAEDKIHRKNRPTVAPEEMGQYFNQVINQLRANPRGMKFSPTGNGATEAGARFYQNKAREIEYRSHAKIAYIAAAENAIQRSYGFVRVTTRYASPRDANQEIWIEDFPNPDMVMPACDAKRPDSSDMKRCFVYQWMPQSEFKRTYPKASITNFSDYGQYPKWVQADKILLAEFWRISTKKRKLLLVQPLAPAGPQPGRPTQMFEDELAQMPGAQVLRELRDVDYPTVRMYLTNGLEILHEQDWLGKYIPIVSCYGKVIYTDGDTGMERQILSMTRFGRAPWKSYCYACSQELEVLAMVPKAPLMIPEGQMTATQLNAVAKSLHEPVAALTYKATLPELPGTLLPPPGPVQYQTGQHLQALELVKEGFRRAIQAAMGSNFLPTMAQRRNEKSGVALDKIGQAASTGTFHFVNNYDDMVRQVGVIVEDLIDKIHDYQGETGVIEAGDKAQSIAINDPNNPEAVSTKGDYLCTVSTGPSSDSETDAVQDYISSLLSNIGTIAQITGPKPAAAIMAIGTRMLNLGPKGDQLADIIEPPEFKQQDGQKPPSPREMSLHQENEQLKGVLQQAQQEKQAKTLEFQSKAQIADGDRQNAIRLQMMKDATTIRVALITAGKERESEQAAQLYDALALNHELSHDGLQAHLDRLHELQTMSLGHQQALQQGQQGVAGQMAVQAAAPQPTEAVA